MKAWHGGLGLAALAAGLGAAALVFAPESPPAGAAGAGAAVSPLALATRPSADPTAPGGVRAAPAVPAPSELDRLVVEARRGDMRAAYGAYQVLSACMAPDGQPCPGVPASLLQERLRFLSNAAQSGVAGAQIDFYMLGPDAMQAVDTDALQAWREQALAGLKSAAAQCEPFAMGLLATLYDAGELMPRDGTQAVAYAVAESLLRRRPASDANLRDRLAEPITDAAIEAARQQGLRQVGACR